MRTLETVATKVWVAVSISRQGKDLKRKEAFRMAEIAVAISGKVSELLIAPIGRQLGFFFQFTRNVETLIKEMEKLRNLKDDVKQEVKVAVNNVDNILNTVETWLEHVDLVDEEAKSIIEDKARYSKGCFNNWCLNLKSRCVLSRRAKKTTRDIIELQQEGKFPKVSLPAPPLLFMGSTSTAFDSRELILNKIIESLKDEDINMIGICGMGGMGKTTLVEKVFKRVKEENMFDDYAMTVVSQRAEMINVQRDIAEMLGLELEENNPVLRASRLNQRLEGKKVFIIVDDVWEQFDLQALGITLQDGQSKCKIVFTSRIQGLWMDFRSRRHELSLEPLTDNESWKLFTEKIGNFLDDNSEFVSVAQQIVNECAGLPLALVTLGSALLGKSKHAWNDSLLKLRTISGMQQKVYESIRLSYDHLDDAEAKSLFLLCSLFKEDSHIDVESLVNIGMGLRLFRGINRVEAARDRVFVLVEHLQSHCLVSVKFDDMVNNTATHYRAKWFVKVHDVVLDVSKSIASTEKGSLVIEHGVTLETSLEQTFVEHCTWISVISEENKELLPILQFPRLKLLLCNNKDVQIPDSCFEGMIKLQVVDISCSDPHHSWGERILKLPSSLQSLTSLHTLCLRDFMLEGFAAIKYLQSLEILLIADDFILELPTEIGELTKLRQLDMSDCANLRKASPGVISGLSNLEELYLGGFIMDWGEEKTGKSENAVRKEFESLSNLRILHILIEDPRFLPITPVFRNLKKYQICIGCSNYQLKYTYDSRNYERILSVCNVDLDKDFNFLVHSSEAVLLEGTSTNRLVYELMQGVSQSIRCLEICDTDTLEYLANMTDCTKATLESLTLQMLNNLQQITNRPLVAGNISKLKKLVVFNCKQLRNTFWLSNALDVLELEKLHVSNCESMEEVICWEGREENSTRKLKFPKLVDLKIGGESLVCFCKGAKEIEFQQLERLLLTGIASIISISDENRGNSIFPSKVLFPSLVVMILDGLKNMKEIWCGQLQSRSYYNLSVLEIVRCDSLEYVFSPYMATYLVHLHTLFMYGCSSLKEIVNGPLVVGSLLKLKELTVKWCNQMRNLLQLSTAVDTVDLEDLEYLYIKHCESMEEVISWVGRPEDATSKLLFPKLRYLKIYVASSLICFCKGATEIEFHQLTNLRLGYLPAVECLVSTSNENPSKSFFPHKVSFGKVKNISLRYLENMTEIWCGQPQAGSFDNLSELEISECESLEYVFSPCTARYLVHLRRLNIGECNNLKEVISAKKEVDGIEEYIRSILPKLEKVLLYRLPALERFYHVANDIEFPELDDVSVTGCPVFKSFSPGFVHTPILNHVKLYNPLHYNSEEDKVTMWKGNINSTIQHLHEDVNPGNAPLVVGQLLDDECPEDFIKDLILSVRSLLPVELLVEECEKRNRLRLLTQFLEHLVSEGSQDVHVHNALGKIIIYSNNNPEHFLTTNPYYDSRVVGKYCEKRDPTLAVVAYRRGQCDEELINNSLFKLQARHVVERMDGDLWEKVLDPENEFRRQLIDQVVSTAVPESKSPEQVSAAVNAFMTVDLPHELIELLEKIVLQNSAFSGNFNLQNLLILTAIKADPSRVMDYVNKLDNFDGPTVGEVAVEAQLYEEAFAIFKKFNLNVQAVTVLLDNIRSIDRAIEFAYYVEEDVVWSEVGKAQLREGLVSEAMESIHTRR